MDKTLILSWINTYQIQAAIYYRQGMVQLYMNCLQIIENLKKDLNENHGP